MLKDLRRWPYTEDLQTYGYPYRADLPDAHFLGFAEDFPGSNSETKEEGTTKTKSSTSTAPSAVGSYRAIKQSFSW